MKSKKVIKGGNERWLVDFTVKGKRQRVYFESEKAANDFISAKEKELKELGEDAFSITMPERAELRACQELLKPTGKTMLEAVRYFVAHHVTQCPKPVGDAIAEMVKKKQESGKSPKYISTMRNKLQKFVRGNEQQLLSEVTREQIENYLEQYESLESRKSILCDIRTLFSFGLKRHWVVKDPCTSIEQIMVDLKRPCIFTIDQTKAWLSAIREHDKDMLAYFALATFAGIRPSEIERIEWPQIDFKKGFVEIWGKTRRRRIVYLSKNCLQLLKEAGQLPKLNESDHRAELKKKVSGLVWGHDIMRHSFGSYHVALNENADQTALHMGNSPQILFARYRELVTKEDAAKFFSIS